jgi:hypothetical protein
MIIKNRCGADTRRSAGPGRRRQRGDKKVEKPKKKQNQPKHHIGKSKAVVKARREKIIKAVLNGKTQRQAGIEAGLKPENIESQVCRILKEPQVNKTFQELLNDTIPDDRQANKYLECLDATKVISANMIAPNGEGMKGANSVTKDFIEVPDYAVQLKANDSISKLKGYVVDKSQHGLDDRVLSVLCSILPAEYVQEFKSKLLELLSQADKK